MRVIRTVILVVLAFCILWMQPAFYAGEYKDYLPNLDSKLTDSPIGTYYTSAKEYFYKYAGRFLVSLTYRKVLVLTPMVDENCVVYINAKPYYLAPIECNDKVRNTLESTFRDIGSKYIYFKQAPKAEEYSHYFGLDDAVKIGYFWSDMPDITKLYENNINLQILASTNAKIVQIEGDTLWKEILP